MSEMKYKPKRWFTLDNAAKIFPPSRSRSFMSLFRLSVNLTEQIDPALLQEALDRCIVRFPGLALRLRRGMFWYYLEQLHGSPRVEPDSRNPCIRIDFKKNNGFMFRVRYHGCKIAAEFFHVLTDGTGGLVFLKTLTAEYLTLRYKLSIPRGGGVLDCGQSPPPEELEDSYRRYARGVTASRAEAAAYHMGYTPLPKGNVNITTGIVPVDSIIAAAHRYKTTVTELLITQIIASVCEQQKKEIGKRRKKPVKVCVPVNMRKFYPSVTLRNFASYVNVGIQPEHGEHTFEEILKQVHHQMGLQTTEKNMNVRMSTNVNSERIGVIRIMPLFIKNPTMKLAFRVNGDRTSSTTLSNLGPAELPEEMKKYVTRFEFLLGPLPLNPVACACISYGGMLYLNVTSTAEESTFERELFTGLVKMGIPVKVESNKNHPEDN